MSTNVVVMALVGAVLAASAVASLSTTTAATTTTTVWPKGWTDLYQAPYQNNPTIMMSLACIEDNLCYAPGATNGQGVNIFNFDGSINAP
ncbi:membrane-associated protein, putative, partial [Bodo saltans]